MISESKEQDSRIIILLSLNAVMILIVGIAIISAIWLNGGMEFRVVGERSDIVSQDDAGAGLVQLVPNPIEASKEIETIKKDDYVPNYGYEFDQSEVNSGELWNERAITIYATPDIDICVGGGLSDLGEMYWQTSNPEVIAGFYNSARTWLGYSNATCRFPVIKGTGTAVVTAGTYDGRRKDSITVTVVDPPIEQWKRDVFLIVNRIRVKHNLPELAWGLYCEDAAEIRANETVSIYSHTRPDGSSWSTACPAPNPESASGENLAIGNAAVSPTTAVSLWMGSEDHRANILSPDYTKLAVGLVFDLDTEYKTYWSQYFSDY